jgi:hypothetical protein
MNDLFTDISYKSVNKHGEEICGDRIEILERDGTVSAVLADGLGSGVRANILSTLTSKIFSTMMAQNMPVEECVSTMNATLPFARDSAAYSTFTVLRVDQSERAEIIRFDNPRVIWLRNGSRMDYTESLSFVGAKNVYTSNLDLCCGDTLIAVSDGALYASEGRVLDYNWDLDGLTGFVEAFYYPDYTAKEICTILLDKLVELYGGTPGDDTSVCVCRIRKRVHVNLVFGPPRASADDTLMMDLFFSKRGKHIVCGGTTAKIAGRYLGQTVVPLFDASDADIPPASSIEGVDLVTEGVLTLSKVLENAEDYISTDCGTPAWQSRQDAASKISAILLEQATDIDLFVGRAENEAYDKPGMPVSLNAKVRLAERLAACLEKAGKRIKVSYF